MLSSHRSRHRDLSLAMIAARLVCPLSKLGLVRSLRSRTAASSLAEVLHIADADEDELYAAMDWLLDRQGRIEDALAKRHLAEGSLVLYDVTSTYFEGRHCPLAKLGHSRDGRLTGRRSSSGFSPRPGLPGRVGGLRREHGDPTTSFRRSRSCANASG